MTFFPKLNNSFRCKSCNDIVPPHESSSRNHCKKCLCSLHVDEEIPGDRKSSCKGLMKPIGLENDSKREYIIVHRCEKCGKISKNKAAGDDNFEEIVKLSQNKNFLEI